MLVRWNGDDDVVKVVILGESGVGKSSVALRFIKEEFHPYIESTIGAEYLSKTIEIEQHQTPAASATRKITFKIWDTAGQEKFHALIPMYYRGAAVGILMFDVSKPDTMHSLERWVKELRKNGPQEMILALCGNKSDLEQDRKVSALEGQRYAHEIGALYVEVSAKQNINVDHLFYSIGERVLAHKNVQDPTCSAFPTCGIIDEPDKKIFPGCC